MSAPAVGAGLAPLSSARYLLGPREWGLVERFEKRALSVGLDAWAPVRSGLGRALPVEEQDATAEQLRARMESVPR